MESFLLSPPALTLLLLASLIYVIIGTIYRLHLSPVAKFPGPRLAGLTFWYEFYYDVFLGGRYTWRIKEMHDKFGPIVRINPYELHVNDPTFYDEVYVGSSKRTEKWAWSARMFGTTQAAVGTVGHDLHRLRRSALNPFFSPKSVSQLGPVIQESVDKLCGRLRDSADTGRPVNISDAFTALSADVIGSYVFGRSYGFLDEPEFKPEWRRFMMDLSRSTHLMKQFYPLYRILKLFPQRLVSLFHPLTRQLFSLQTSISNQITAVRSELVQTTYPYPSKTHHGVPSHSTVFHAILQNPSIPSAELLTSRLTEEALTLLGAGTVTTAHTLSTTLYHILSNPSILSTLREELATAYATQHPDRPSWTSLCTLPYLSAVIKEGLRTSYGVSHRLARVAPDRPLFYTPQPSAPPLRIPPGIPISMTQMLLHTSPSLFPEPERFDPRRWLKGSDGCAAYSDEQRALMKRFLVPFSRGTRACLGRELAYAEIGLALAGIFGPGGPCGRSEGYGDATGFGEMRMRLWDTRPEDVRVTRDWFNPAVEAGIGKGVCVLIESVGETNCVVEAGKSWANPEG